MQTALNIAKYIHSQGYRDNIKINKLLYISFGFYGAVHDKHLFPDRIEAWKYGPVIPDVYSAFNNGYFDTDIISLEENEKTSIDRVLHLYGSKAPFLLVDLTHQKDTPWSNSYVPGERNIEIKKDTIINYYKNIIQISNQLVEEISGEDFRQVMIELSKT
ncbi:MAG: DUF4065 domain-containing protein [Flavobacteriaceae bacterium]|jgi:uncharacterized phage-associated protein|nr:DUF4065 domain-containing protein [Flavobacteriaceae bacterium]